MAFSTRKFIETGDRNAFAEANPPRTQSPGTHVPENHP